MWKIDNRQDTCLSTWTSDLELAQTLDLVDCEGKGHVCKKLLIDGLIACS